MVSTRNVLLLASFVLSEFSYAVPTNYDYVEIPSRRDTTQPIKRDDPQFALGEPIDGKGKGAPILGE